MEETPKRKELTLAHRQSAYCIIYQSLKNGALPHGIFSSTAKLFKVSKSTIGRLWRDTNVKIANEGVTAFAILTNTDFFETKSKNRGRPLKWNREEVREEVRNVPLSLRQTWDGLSQALKVPASTLRYMRTKEKLFYRHSSSLTHYLTDDHKIARLSYVLDEIHMETVDNNTQ